MIGLEHIIKSFAANFKDYMDPYSLTAGACGTLVIGYLMYKSYKENKNSKK